MNLGCKNLEQFLLGIDHSIKILTIPTLGFHTQHHFPFPFCPSPSLLHLHINTPLSTASFSSPEPGIGTGFEQGVLLETDKSPSPYSFRKQVNFRMGQRCESTSTQAEVIPKPLMVSLGSKEPFCKWAVVWSHNPAECGVTWLLPEHSD